MSTPDTHPPTPPPLADVKEVGFCFKGKRDGLALTWARLAETRSILRWAHLGPDRRRRGPLPDSRRRPRVEKLPMHCRRNEQGSVKMVSEVNLAAQDQIVHRPCVRDDDHRRLGRDALTSVAALGGGGAAEIQPVRLVLGEVLPMVPPTHDVLEWLRGTRLAVCVARPELPFLTPIRPRLWFDPLLGLQWSGRLSLFQRIRTEAFRVSNRLGVVRLSTWPSQKSTFHLPPCRRRSTARMAFTSAAV